MSVDSFVLDRILNEILDQIRNVTDTFALVGIGYTLKLAVKSILRIISASNTYLLSSIISNEGWLRSLGNWAIVTGCTSGVGFGYCRELAKARINLILIDKNLSLIDKLADELVSNYGVDVIKIAADFNDLNSYSSIEKAIIARDVGILVNGYSISCDYSYFHTTSKRVLNEQISVNAMAATHLTRMLLPSLVAKNKGAIVYVSSMEARLPSPYNAIGAASNCFMEKLFDSLRHELSDTRIVFQCLSPIQNSDHSRFNKAINEDQQAINNYARHAIRTLGWSDNTAGYWIFGLQFVLLEIIPTTTLNCLYSAWSRRKFHRHHESWQSNKNQ